MSEPDLPAFLRLFAHDMSAPAAVLHVESGTIMPNRAWHDHTRPGPS